MIVDQMSLVSLQHSEYLEDNYDESGFTNNDVSMSNGKLPNGINGHSPRDTTDVGSNLFNSASPNRSLHDNKEADISID